MTSEEVAAQMGNPAPDTISPLLWDTLYSAEIRSAGQFDGITAHVADNWEAWQKWYAVENPYESNCPGDYEQKLSSFDKLILIKTLRPELVQVCMTSYIITEMDKFFVEPPPTGMNILYENID